MTINGVSLRDQGIQQASDNAEAKTAGWNDLAYSALLTFLCIHSGRFQAEDFRVWAHANGLPKPPHARAFGGVIVRAKRRGIIHFVGFEKVSNPQAHCANAAIWIKSCPQERREPLSPAEPAAPPPTTLF